MKIGKLSDYEEVKKAARDYFNKKAVGRDEINRLKGQELSYSVYHHWGLGRVAGLQEMIKRADQEEIKAKLHELERKESEFLINMLLGYVDQDSRVFDGGSGSGGVAFDLHTKHGCSVDGVNISDQQVALTNRLAKEKGVKDKVKFYEMDMVNTSFEANTFDAAINVETTMYVKLDNYFSELSRILKKGGVHAMITWGRADEYIEKNSYADEIDIHYGVLMHSPTAYREALEKQGFKIKGVLDVTDRVVDYFKLRSVLEIATGVEQPLLKGFEKGYLKQMVFISIYEGE